MYKVIFAVIFICICGCGTTEPPIEEIPVIVIDTNSVNGNIAYEYLNFVRSNPEQNRCENCNFERYLPQKPLKVNYSLQTVAWKRAADMATNGYTSLLDTANVGIDMRVAQFGYKFDSTNYDKSTSNYGTATYSYSNSGNVDIKSMIDDLIRGPGRFSDGEEFNRYNNSQRLLMGLNENSRLDEIGIGFCYSYNKSTNSNYKYYLCVIVAKQKE